MYRKDDDGEGTRAIYRYQYFSGVSPGGDERKHNQKTKKRGGEEHGAGRTRINSINARVQLIGFRKTKEGEEVQTIRSVWRPVKRNKK